MEAAGYFVMISALQAETKGGITVIAVNENQNSILASQHSTASDCLSAGIDAYIWCANWQVCTYCRLAISVASGWDRGWCGQIGDIVVVYSACDPNGSNSANRNRFLQDACALVNWSRPELGLSFGPGRRERGRPVTLLPLSITTTILSVG